MLNRVVVYPSRNQWWWRVVAAENGRTLARSSEGYADRRDAEHAAQRLFGEPSRSIPVEIQVLSDEEAAVRLLRGLLGG